MKRFVSLVSSQLRLYLSFTWDGVAMSLLNLFFIGGKLEEISQRTVLERKKTITCQNMLGSSDHVMFVFFLLLKSAVSVWALFKGEEGKRLRTMASGDLCLASKGLWDIVLHLSFGLRLFSFLFLFPFLSRWPAEEKGKRKRK